LIEEAMKEKLASNFIKEENIKLKTKTHLLETELLKKEKIIDELLLQ
jgi:hypothetical protein